MKKVEEPADALEEENPRQKRFPNDIREIRTIRMLERIDLDFESPRLRRAMDEMGVTYNEC
jgi:hypothetical protein